MINVINHPIVFDLAKEINKINAIQIKKNDTASHKFVISVLNNSLAYNLSGLTARIYFKKNDGTRVFLDCTIDDAVNGMLGVILTTQSLSCAGIVSADVTIYGTAGELLTSTTFTFLVNETIRDDAAIQSSNEYTALTNALTTYNALKSEVETARGTYLSLDGRLDGFDSSLEDKTNYTDLKGIQVPYFKSGAVAGWIDDDCPIGFNTDLKPLCNTYNFKVGLACITGLVGTTGKMTLQDLLSLQGEGYEVYSHSVTHDSALWYGGNLINADSATLTSELQTSQNYLKNNGIKTYDTFVYPGGGYAGGTERTKAKNLTKQFYRYGINSGDNYSTFPIDNMYVPRLQVQVGKNFATDIQPVLDAIIATNAIFIIVTHSGGTSWDSALATQVIEYLQAHSVPIMPARQALELKGNAIAIGDVEARTHNKLVVGKDGSIVLPVKYIDGEAPISAYSVDGVALLDGNSLLTAFPSYCESVMFCRNTAGMPGSNPGLLFTYHSWVGSGYNYQRFISSNTFKVWYRSWNEGTSSWNTWVFISTLSIQAVDSIPITQSGNSYTTDMPVVVPYSDSYASANNLPGSGACIVTTWRFTSGTPRQELKSNYDNRTWIRYYYNNAWTPFILTTPSSTATNAMPQINLTGYMSYNTDYFKPFWIKSYGTPEVDTLTISAGATASGNITVTLNGVSKTVAVNAGDSATAVGDKIRATIFNLWNVSGSGATVTFTKIQAGTNTTPTFTDTGSTGVTASFAVTTAGVANTYVDANSAILGNIGVNITVTASSATKAVTFGKTEPNANYAVSVSPSWNTTFWITNKSTTGFTINFGTAPSVDSTLDWSIRR